LQSGGNALHRKVFDGGSGRSSWQNRGSLSSANGSAPALSSFVTGNKAVSFRGADNTLWQRLY